MSIPLAITLLISSSFINASAIPLFEQVRVNIFQLLSSLIQAQIPFTFLVMLGVVSLWRGAWGLMDLHIFPKNNSLSYLFSFIVGLAILLSTCDLAKQFL